MIPRARKIGAASILIVMVGAFVTHLVRGELIRLITPAVLGVLAYFIFSSASIAKGRKANC